MAIIPTMSHAVAIVPAPMKSVPVEEDRIILAKTTKPDHKMAHARATKNKTFITSDLHQRTNAGGDRHN